LQKEINGVLMGEGKGFGKTILFGDHFVVYGLPGVAAGLSSTTTAKVEKSEKFEFADNRPETPGYKEKKQGEIQRQLDALLEYFKIDKEKNPYRITLSGNLVCASGVGASAALAASIARAFNQELGLGLNDEKINEIAYLAEEAGSGTPSGIDNTTSVFGGFITFEKNLEGSPNKIGTLSVSKPVEIVLASTGITQETKAVVGEVKAKKESDEKWFEGVSNKYKEVCEKGLEAIKKEDWKTVGEMMDKNQDLLKQIDVSCKEIEDIVKGAKEAGAWGAKLTGTGRGGYVLLLTPGSELQEKVAKAIEGLGFKTVKTSIGGK
jgi:mevalonate kinase